MREEWWKNMGETLSPSLRAAVAMEKHSFRYSHSLGQNFITDDELIGSLLDAAEVGPEDCVLEIGPGAGIMTAALAERCQTVLALEIDRRLEGVLADVLAGYPNARVEFQDVMKADIASLAREAFGGRRFRVVANLPYYITADVVLRLLTGKLPLQSVCVMVQKEAAERMMAAMGGKNWCALAATVQYFAEPRVLMEVPPEAFTPPPHVQSRFVRLDMYPEPPVRPRDEALFLRTIQCAFAMRRKTMANNLKATFGFCQEEAAEVLEKAGQDARVRGEALSLEELADLSDALLETLSKR